MTAGLTAVERKLSSAGFGDAVLMGFYGNRETVAAARVVQTNARGRAGYKAAPAPVLTPGASQHKLAKNTTVSLGLMLTPARGMMAPERADIRAAFRLTGPINVCPLASDGCAKACLSTSGQSGMPAQQRAQSARTAFLLAYPRDAGLIIGAEIRAAIRRHGVINLRLNTTSDIRWELVAPGMVYALSRAGVRMYDYTAWRPEDRNPSRHYSLTYSAKEPGHTSDAYLTAILESGNNVAMPFDTRRGEALPAAWHGYPVIDGDESDERYRDPRGVVVGLRAKGHAWRRDNSAGFIRSASAV